MAGHPLQDYDRADEAIVAFYLQSGDFNGMPSSALAHALGLDQEKLDDLLTVLVRREIATLSFGDRHPNPRIKAFEPQTIPEQLDKLSRLGTNHLCVYPTAERLKATVDPDDFSGQPFTLRLALGEPQLHLLSFDLTVLEKYRNDPRYYYTNNDVGGSIAARDAEKGVEMPEQDQVLLQTFGFSFDKELNRAVAVFLRYLAGLSREHQAIWNAHLLDGMYTCHPDYGRSSMGHWPEGISVFEAFLGELAEVNALCHRIGYPKLFRREFGGDERPRRFGFLLRPTRQEFHDFVALLDRMMSDNLNRDFFRTELEMTRETERRDGRIEVQHKATIALLDEWLTKMYRMKDPMGQREIIDVFRRVRQLRQRPAHAVDADRFDQSYLTQQRELVRQSWGAVVSLRHIFSRHPRTVGYKLTHVRDDLQVWMY